MAQFHALTLLAVTPETAQAVCLRFAVPPDLQAAFSFQAGQFVTLRATIDGLDVRRSYSICSTPQQYAAQGTFEVGVKAVEGGTFSTWAQALSAGAVQQVMPPDGRFTLPAGAKRSLCIAAGSGITPILAMISERLASNAQAQFTLLYGNRGAGSVMFLEALGALKNRYAARLDIHHVLSRQASEITLHNGHLDGDKLRAFFAGPLLGAAFDVALVCGSNDLIDACEAVLPELGVAQVMSERFGTPHTGAPRAALPPAQAAVPLAQLAIVSGGVRIAVPWTAATPLLLDAGLLAGLDLPYACKGGVCCTCRAKVMEGSVEMDKNYTLEADELAAGYVLTCQCRPTSAAVVVSFDER